MGALNAFAEDVGLVNVAKKCLQLGCPRLVTVSATGTQSRSLSLTLSQSAPSAKGRGRRRE